MAYFSEKLRAQPLFAALQQLADRQEIPTYVVGGFVRDMLLERASKDVDIVCVGQGSGIRLAKALAASATDASVQVFTNFGTAMVRWNGWEVEFVGARKESYQKDSRNPQVEEGTLEEDQLRRDFGINTIAVGLNEAHFGKVYDPLGGREELAQELIQTPRDPRLTFYDDPLRMLRAIRFACQLRFCLAEPTSKAIHQEAERIAIISKERITSELNKIICSPQPARGLLLLEKLDLLPRILPEFSALKGVEKIGHRTHKDNFYHTLQVLTNVAKVSDSLYLRWATILHDIAKPRTKRFDPIVGFTFHGHEDVGARMVPTIFRKLRLPLGKPMRYVQKLVALHLRPIALVKKEVTDTAIRRFIHDAGEDVDDLMILCRADITSKNHARVQGYLHNFELVEQKIKAVKVKDYVRNLKPVLDGDDIMQIFRLKPGKMVGMLKNELKEAVLDGAIPNEAGPLYDYLCLIAAKQKLAPTLPNPNKFHNSSCPQPATTSP
jgi:poly(A) polymerase